MTKSGSYMTLIRRCRDHRVCCLVLPLAIGIFVGHFWNIQIARWQQHDVTALSRLPVGGAAGKVRRSYDDNCADDDATIGWKNIHVFYGDVNHLPIDSQLAIGSQVQQDVIVMGLLGNRRQGYFVDLASNEATFLSNTYRLETELDWEGLCIEANPAYWRSLTYRKCTVVAAAVGGVAMQEVNFQYTDEPLMGGIEGKQFDNAPGTHSNTPTKYYTTTLPNILERMKSPTIMDYLSLDVEGAEYFVMEHFPFDRYRFRILTIERPKDQLRALLSKHGYEEICTLVAWGETLWVSTQDKFSLNFSFDSLPPDCRPMV